MTASPSRALLALLLAGATLAAQPTTAAPKAEEPAAAASGPTLRPQTAPIFKAAQDLQMAKDWVGMLAKLKEAEAVGNLSPYEQFLVARGRAIALYYSKDYAGAAAQFRTALDSEYLTPAERVPFLEVLFQIHRDDLKQYDLAIADIAEYRKAGGTKTEILEAEAQTRYLKGDNRGAAAGFQAEIDAHLAKGEAPPERLLRMQAGAQQQANDEAGLARTVEVIARYYPKRDVWDRVLETVQEAPGVEKMRLDRLRLRYATVGYGDKDGQRMVAHGQLALSAGYAAEAKQVLDEAFARKIIAANDAGEAAKTRDAATRSLAKEKLGDKASEASPRAAKDGDPLFSYGLAVFFTGDAERGLGLMQAGLAKGVKNTTEAKLHYGMALLRAGRLKEARDVLQPLSGPQGAGAIARVYVLWIDAGAKLPGDAPAAKTAGQ